MKNSGWPGRNWWVTEYADAFFSGDGGAPVPNEWTFSRNSFQNLISHVSGGASGAAVYDGIDALYQHHNFQVNSLGQIGWNPTTNVYSVRKRFYANGMLYKFVRPGAVRIDSSTTRTGLVQLAFYNPASGQISIVGRNS